MKIAQLICAAAMIAATPAFADHPSRDGGIDERQYRLEQRVEQGRRSGEITRQEYRHLAQELRLIARDEHAFRADGFLSPRERQVLHARLDEVSRAVYRESHDGQRRYGYYNDGHYADRRF
jgi:hypothetical protein